MAYLDKVNVNGTDYTIRDSETALGLDNLKSEIATAPTEATGKALLVDEETNTTLLAAALDNIDYLIAHLPQDDALAEIVAELQTENSWLDVIYFEVAARLEDMA